MKYTVKRSVMGRWIVYLSGFGQFGESYETKQEAIDACNHYTSHVIFC